MKDIYWVEVYERETGTLDTKKVLQEYPFPDVPFNLHLETFEDRINLIEDTLTRLATHRRYRFIIDIWHPTNFFRIVRRPWKYAK
jgi:hypothetical protein